MIRKLLLVRINESRSDLLDSAGLKSFAGDPLSVSPIAWPDEAGLSHYGFVLSDLKLKDWQELQKWNETNPQFTVTEFSGNADEALASVGLKINKSAEE